MINGKYIIALCLSKPHDRDCHTFISSLNDALCEMNCRLLVYSTCSDLYWGSPSEKGETAVFELIDYDTVDAVILFSEKLADRNVREDISRKAEMHDIPVIYIGGIPEKGISVRFDYEAGFESLARHIIEHHKAEKIHYMAGFKGNEFSERRFEVLKRVMAENGLDTPDDMISYGDFWSAPAERAAEALVARGDIPDAVICANDVMAITVCEVLGSHGYRVPEDVLVTGMDGVDEIYFSTPKITSCEFKFTDISSRIAELLPDILSRKLTEGDYCIAPSMILSQSCGCSEGKHIPLSKYLNMLNNRLSRFQNDEHMYSRAAVKMQTAASLEEGALEIKAAVGANKDIACPMCCLLIEKYISDRTDLFSTENDGFGDRMYLYYDHDRSISSEDGYIPIMFDRKDVIPDLYGKLENKYPLVFAALNFLDKPLGYTCFYFRDHDIINYARIPQTVDYLNSAVSGFITINHQRYLNSKIERMYESDALTKLYNRNGFSREYDRLISSLEDGETLSVIVADLDGLKLINDNYGHGEGDSAIFTVAEALRSVFDRKAVCGRFGGDELVAVLRGAADKDAVKADFERYFNKYNASSGKPYKVTASIGIYTTETGGSMDFETLFKEADKQMYDDKALRRAGHIQTG